MFVPVEQQYRVQFIQWQNLKEHLIAFDQRRSLFSYGHLFFSDGSAIELAGVRKILLYRDPYDWVLARARFFLSDATAPSSAVAARPDRLQPGSRGEGDGVVWAGQVSGCRKNEGTV